MIIKKLKIKSCTIIRNNNGKIRKSLYSIKKPERYIIMYLPISKKLVLILNTKLQ